MLLVLMGTSACTGTSELMPQATVTPAIQPEEEEQDDEVEIAAITGDGIFLIKVNPALEEEKVVVPIKDAGGTRVGKLVYRATGNPHYLHLKKTELNGEKLTVERDRDLIEIAYEFSGLIHYGKQEKRLGVLAPHMAGLWVDTRAIDDRVVTMNWVEVVVKTGNVWGGFDSYRVRTTPSLDGKLLVQLRDQDLWPNKSHQVKPTGNIKGHWVEVSAQTYQGPHWCMVGDEGEKPVGDPIVGWVKIADDDGTVPDIMMYTRGC
jgi:hypothetical protein